MKILVTGSNGTLGRLLVKELENRGNKVYGIDVNHSDNINYARCDIRSMMQLERVFFEFKPDFVYHLAAEFGRNNGEDYYDTLWETNVVGTKNILVLQRKLKFKLIFASSSEAYGELPENVPYKEDSPHGRFYNDYAMTKWVNEQQIKNEMERYNTQTMILRFFNAYGAGEKYHPYRSVIALFIYKLIKKMPITVYKGYHRVFMHIDDFIPTLANAYDKFTVATINIGGEEYRSVEDLAKILVAYFPEGKINLINKEVMNVVNKKPDISLAKQILGHNPTITLEEGLKRTIPWYINMYKND